MILSFLEGGFFLKKSPKTTSALLLIGIKAKKLLFKYKTETAAEN